MSQYNCPICGQYMDFIVVSHRSKPFIDGKLYPKMCFGCFHTPQEYTTTYTQDGSVDNQEGPFYSHRMLKTPQELFNDGAVENLRQAQKCVDGVKRACRSVGVKALDKLKLKKPDPDYDFNDEYEDQQQKIWDKEKKKKFKQG